MLHIDVARCKGDEGNMRKTHRHAAARQRRRTHAARVGAKSPAPSDLRRDTPPIESGWHEDLFGGPKAAIEPPVPHCEAPCEEVSLWKRVRNQIVRLFLDTPPRPG